MLFMKYIRVVQQFLNNNRLKMAKCKAFCRTCSRTNRVFEQVYYRDDKNLLDFENGKIIFRNAVRAIIKDGGKILMAYLEKTDEYKFSGGGKEENETAEEAVKREVLEEVGYNVKKINGKIGSITEYAVAQEGGNNIFKMISDYYLVEIDKEPVEQKLEEYEKEFMFKPCWVEMEKAYKTNKERIENKNAEKTGGINRETIVLEILKEKERSRGSAVRVHNVSTL